MFKSKRAGIAAGIIVLLLAAALGVGIYVRTFTVQTVYVVGNVHYTEDEIKAIVMDGPLGDNSLYLSFKYANGDVEGIPFVDTMDVSVLSRDTIKITVYEKNLTGCVRYLDTYMYFDRDGYVLESSGIRTVGVPQILGLSFDYLVVGKQIPVDDPGIFGDISNLTMLLQKYSLISDKIYFNRSGEITVYFGGIKVALGEDTSTLEDKLGQLAGILPKLEGRSGTLQMQTYDDNSGAYTFKPE